jgi:sulfur carrier protein
MQLTVNGEEHEHRGDGTVSSLLEELGADRGRVALMVNAEVVARERRDGLLLREGDRIEVLTFAGGG